MKYLCAMLIALLMPFATAHATLITADSSLGSGTAVLDTSTGLEWLKFSSTRNMSINQVFLEMEPGGSLNGFHYANSREFYCLVFPSILYGCEFSPPFKDATGVQTFFNLFGIRLPLDDGIVTFYQVDPPGSKDPREAYVALFVLYAEPIPNLYFDSQSVPLSQTRLNEQPQLHWLVGEAQAVPEPSTLALLAIGALVMAKRRMSRGENRLKNAHSGFFLSYLRMYRYRSTL